MDDFDIAQSKIGESAQRVIDRAVEEARRRNHAVLTNEHILLAYTQIEWDIFTQVMRSINLEPHEILQALEEHLQVLSKFTDGRGLKTALATKLVFKLALHQASHAGRQTFESSDLFSAIFEDNRGVSVSIIHRFGVEPEVIKNRIMAMAQKRKSDDEYLKKKFELPPTLKHFATNLNLLAHQDKLSSVYGRDGEIQQVLEILCHRERPNSVMIIGEPGVGKTAIVEGLARRIEFEPDTIPVRLRDCQIVNIQMNTMVAGTVLRGMFEERIQHVIREIKERPNLIIFVDEAHTMVGAGSALGAPSDAAQVFKSALARGEMKMIAATTSSEYKARIAEDEALARRFRTVYVRESTIEETRDILRSIRSRLERNYSVRILDEALDTALEISPRYQRHLHLPDKIIGWLDTAAVCAEIGRRWEVTASDVMDVVSGVSQIPRDMVFRDVSDRFKDIEERLGRRVVGQREAIKAVAVRLILNKGPLKENFYRPDGVLLFLGPTGVGKTELAKAVAEFLFGDDKKMIRIDMSEYQNEMVSADKLIGMPRGVVGSEHGGILTTQLKDNPYSVVLLDEIEKASSSVLNLFLSAFDEGWMTDGRGKRVYLSDAIVIMTSNIGSRHFRKLSSPMGFRSGQIPLDQIQGEINRELERQFSPEFRNRIDQVIMFQPLTLDEVGEIALKYLNELSATLRRWDKLLEVRPEALEKIVKDGYSPAFGARFLKRVIDDQVKLPISQRWKEGKIFTVKTEKDNIVIEVAGNVNRNLKDDFAVV